MLKEIHELYPATPIISLYDPLAHLLGAGEGYFTYRFIDAVKLSGHACPTVAGAYLMTIHALKALYEECTPVRGQIKVTMPGPVDSGNNGPTSQVITLMTGAAADNGFQGLNGHHARNGLLQFADSETGKPICYERTDNGKRVGALFDASAIPPDPEINELMPQIMKGQCDPTVVAKFGEMWRARVVAILEDDGKKTITLTPVT